MAALQGPGCSGGHVWVRPHTVRTLWDPSIHKRASNLVKKYLPGMDFEPFLQNVFDTSSLDSILRCIAEFTNYKNKR